MATENEGWTATDSIRLIEGLAVRLVARGVPLAEDMKVQVHLLDDAVEVDCWLQVFACGVSLTDRQIDRAAMIEEIEMGSTNALAAWVKGSDQFMTL